MICVKCAAEVPDGPYCLKCGWKQQKAALVKHKRGNGQGSAIKRGNTWTGFAPGYSFMDADGKRHRVRPSKGGFKTKSEALAWALQKGNGEKDVPVPKLIELWTEYSTHELEKLSAEKQTAYKIAAKRLTPLMGRRIDKLTVSDLQAVVDTVTTYYPARDMRTVLSHLYTKAMASNTNTGRVTQNLADFITLPDLEEKEAVPFTSDEVQKLWKLYESGERFVGYLLLLIYSGMMPSELFKCKKDMVDLEHCEIRGAGAKTKTRQKSAIAFPVFIRPVLEDLLSIECTNSRSNNDKLLSMNKWTFYDEFRRMLELAGINNPKDEKGRYRLSPYSCRHTFGTEAVKLEIHPEMIKQMLRHGNTRTQEKYTHLGSKELHDAVDKLKK